MAVFYYCGLGAQNHCGWRSSNWWYLKNWKMKLVQRTGGHSEEFMDMVMVYDATKTYCTACELFEMVTTSTVDDNHRRAPAIWLTPIL